MIHIYLAVGPHQFIYSAETTRCFLVINQFVYKNYENAKHTCLCKNIDSLSWCALLNRLPNNWIVHFVKHKCSLVLRIPEIRKCLEIAFFMLPRTPGDWARVLWQTAFKLNYGQLFGRSRKRSADWAAKWPQSLVDKHCGRRRKVHGWKPAKKCLRNAATINQVGEIINQGSSMQPRKGHLRWDSTLRRVESGEERQQQSLETG